MAQGQRHYLLVGGARSGKTFLLVRALIIRAVRAAGSRHVIFRHRYNAVMGSVWHETFPKVMALCFPGLRATVNHAYSFQKFWNGSEIWFSGLDEKERLEKILGKEYATIFLNECSQIGHSSAETVLTRLAQRTDLTNRAFYDLNPTTTAHWTHRLFLEHRTADGREDISEADQYGYDFMNPNDNAANLDQAYIASLGGLSARQRRRFLEGRYSSDVENALWNLDSFKRCEAPADLRRVVIGVDPSGCSGPEDARSDEVGIVVAGQAGDGKLYLLADRSGRYSPDQWARVVATARKEFAADRVVAEKNFGGAMVESVLKVADPYTPLRLVDASRGKVIRAEPIAALYEHDNVRHVGRFDEIEDQLLNFSTGGYLGERSPDRADALVWALTELMAATGGMYEYMRGAASEAKAKAAQPSPNPYERRPMECICPKADAKRGRHFVGCPERIEKERKTA